MLSVYLIHLIRRGIGWYVSLHVCDVALGRQSSACHVIRYAISLSRNVAICHRPSQGPFGSFDIFDRPVDGVSLRLLVDPEHEADQELAVAKDPDRESEVRAGVDQCLQAMDGIPHRKALCLVIGSAWSVISPGTNDLLSFAIQDDESSCSYSVLRPPIKLHMHCLPLCKARLWWKVCRRLQGRLSC